MKEKIDFSELIIGTTSSGKVIFKNEFNDKLVELYRDNKKDDIIKYCNNIYEKIYQNLNIEFSCMEQELCNAIILEALKNRKTETSNVIGIAINALKDVNVKKEKIYEELSNMNDYERTEIINGAVLLLLALL
ncbi:hypothetical protein [Clostridium baratii]|uniref:hypothetical protein n=1 Tax=Clostridium baratii TaxID=1561 RepID=UPI0030D5E380